MRPVMILAGTRPEVIKLAPVIVWLERLGVEYVFVWSGQHYDYALSKVFFEEFGLPEPEVDLGAGSASHAKQTAKIMVKLERLIQRYLPAVVMAEGDTNTVVAAALTASKCLTPFAHVEAGLRSWSMVMPEEVNRRVADGIASLHFAPTELAAFNLLFEGVSSRNVYVTGNTIVDALEQFKSRVEKSGGSVLDKYQLEKESYVLVTLHRAENVDSRERLGAIAEAISELTKDFPVVFPIHPRTRKMLTLSGLLSKLNRTVRLLKPLGYFEFLSLLKNCRVVLTDSGGVQEEAFTLRIPTVTLRYNTERPETTFYGINVLAGAEKERIIDLTMRQWKRYEEIRRLSFENPLGDGLAGKRIAKLLMEAVQAGIAIKDPDLRMTPTVEYRLLNREDGLSEEALELLVAFDADGKPVLVNSESSRILARVAGKLNDKNSPHS